MKILNNSIKFINIVKIDTSGLALKSTIIKLNKVLDKVMCSDHVQYIVCPQMYEKICM